MQDPNLFSTVTVDGLAPNGARPPTGAVLTEITFSVEFRWLSMILRHIYGTVTSSKMSNEIQRNLTALQLLIHCGLMTTYGDKELGEHLLR